MSKLITVSEIVNAQVNATAKMLNHIAFKDSYKVYKSHERVLFLQFLLKNYPDMTAQVDPDTVNADWKEQLMEGL